MINLEAPRLEVDEPQPDIGSEQILTASKIRELWSKTYNTDGKPDILYSWKIQMQKDSLPKHNVSCVSIVRLRKKGMSNQETAEIFGLSVGTCSRIWQIYKREGMKGISLKTRGRRLGDKRRLSAEQEAEIQKQIVVNTPDQLRFSFALWTREAIGQLIKRQYGIDLP